MSDRERQSERILKGPVVVAVVVAVVRRPSTPVSCVLMLGRRRPVLVVGAAVLSPVNEGRVKSGAHTSRRGEVFVAEGERRRVGHREGLVAAAAAAALSPGRGGVAAGGDVGAGERREIVAGPPPARGGSPSAKSGGLHISEGDAIDRRTVKM